MTRKFVLCIGASKSGTTWLYHYLRRQSNVALGFRKEYNALSKIFASQHISVPPPNIRVMTELGAKVASNQLIQRKMCESVEEYCSYFDNLTPDSGISMDISPSYISLTSENINEVILKFLEKGFTTYVVLLLRDPIDRVISFSRMAIKYKLLRSHLGIKNTDTLQDVVQNIVLNSEFNTDYSNSIRNLLMVDPRTHKFIYPYENLTSPDGVAHLSSSLQLEKIDGFENKYYNRGHDSSCQEKILTDQLRHLLEDQYRFCFTFFSSQGVNPEWRNFIKET